MRDLTPFETPNLFTPEMLAEPDRPPDGPSDRPSDTEAQQSDRVARDFVRWCCNVGSDFRNSPDVTNFRWWLQKNNMKVSQSEEHDILVEARRLLLKKVEQAIRKLDVPKVSD